MTRHGGAFVSVVIPVRAGIQVCRNDQPIGRLAFPGRAKIATKHRRGIVPRSGKSGVAILPAHPVGGHAMEHGRGTHATIFFLPLARRGAGVGFAFRLLLVSALLLPAMVCSARAEEPNTLTPAEKNAGWRLIFDGHTTTGWRGFKSAVMPASWKVENGSLLSRHEQGDTMGDIVTEDQYGDFELTLEWKMTTGGNSGVIYRATEDCDNVWETGPEYQILDNTGHMDGLNPLASAGACYAVFAPARDMTKALGQWNQTRIVARGNHVEHWMNGEKLLEYDIDTEFWRAHVKTSRYYLTAYGKGTWGLAPKGHIAIQDYGGAIEFRNIKIRPYR